MWVQVPRLAWAGLIVVAMTAGLRAQEADSTPAATSDGAAASYRRVVSIPGAATARPSVVVTEFFTHGALDAAAAPLSVVDAKGQAMPWKNLQNGPGDFVRVAFQPAAGRSESTYEIRYGGKETAAASPAWDAGRGGLLFTAYRWRDCDLNRIESVREAIDKAEPIGADFVPAVYHRYNPVDPSPRPFLSRYEGRLLAPAGGTYEFFTTSQDASFLLIDGRVVVASPGWHGPVGDARHRGEVSLKAGPHDFEYLHACAGENACMVAAWKPPGAEKPEPIPPAAFGSNLVAHLAAVGPTQDGAEGSPGRRLHDMAVAVLGEVPVMDSPEPMVRVQFQHRSAGSGGGGGVRVRWEFGDGQNATGADPMHVYLHPGLYTVTMMPGGPTGPKVTNRVSIGRALVPEDPKLATPDALAAYLPAIEAYDVAGLDGPGVLQLARVDEQAGRITQLGKLAAAWLASPRAGEDEAATEALLNLAVPRLRDTLGDPAAALALCTEAAGRLRDPSRRRDSLSRAADVGLNDLLRGDPEVAGWVDEASSLAGSAGGPSSLSLRVQGDLKARQGDREGARRAYTASQKLRDASRNASEQLAWRGAHSRSVESFLREDRLDEALAEIRAWTDDAPLDRLDGDLPLLLAQLWVKRKQYDRAVAVASDLVAANPDSAYADQLLMMAAEAEVAAKRPDRARARWQSLVTDYPGSPLVPEARKKLEASP
jgi:TolA-binding protein